MKNRTWDRWRTHFLFHRSIVTMGKLHASGSATKPNHIPMLEERVDTLSKLVILLISHFWESANKSVEMAVPDDKVDGFLSPKEEKEWEEAKKGKACLPKFVPPQPFDGTMKDTKSFISSLILYIYGRKAEFPNNKLKIMFALSYMWGGKCSTGKMKPSILLQPGRSHSKISKTLLCRWRLSLVIWAPRQPPLGN